MSGRGRAVSAALVGKQFGRWTVIERAGSDKHKKAVWKCLCECGTEGIISTRQLTSGKSKSCGCLLSDTTAAKNIARGERNRKNKYLNRKGFLRNQIRKIFHKWPPYYEIIKEAHIARGQYLCAGYEREPHIVGYKDYNVDHIEPIGELISWDTWLDRLFCDKTNLQLLCIDCHKLKSKKETEGGTYKKERKECKVQST